MDKITESNFWMQKESKCCIIKCICVGRYQSSKELCWAKVLLKRHHVLLYITHAYIYSVILRAHLIYDHGMCWTVLLLLQEMRTAG